ncbi:type VI secretion system Vgr family protein [Bacterioplanoides sp.]|uniref:type VI secretion system Vgr family protein n=1 Tax=Bacterioplanoides sp. TaxID=2066072 RepID=UPI003AFF913D
MSALKFSFSTQSTVGKFDITSFTGKEAISELFHFEISLRVRHEDVDSIDFSKIIQEDAWLMVEGTVKGEPISHKITGMLEQIDEEYQVSKEHKYYRAVLRPLISRHTQNRSYDIYTQMNVRQILQEELDKDLEVKSVLAIKEDASYPVKEFVCQYAESNFDFVSRLAAHWGIYFYFDHANNSLVFADDAYCEQCPIPKAYIDISNNPSMNTDTIRTFRKSFQPIPPGVIVTEVNPDQASEHFGGTAGDTNEKTCVHLVNEGCDSQDEADFIATIRLQRYQTQAVYYHGTSGIPCLAPGFFLTVYNSHNDTEEEVLITEVIHSAKNLYDQAAGESGEAVFYEATFKGIPSDVVFRPKIKPNAKPRAISTTARVASETDDQALAHRNQLGKYKVIFDFLKDEKKLSHWIRLARPTAHTNHMEMPLTPNTEVQIAFVDGNPDRPFIQSALENSQSLRHPVTNENPHHASIRTDGLLYTEALKSRKELHIAGNYDQDEVLDTIQNLRLEILKPNGETTNEEVDLIAGDHHITEHYGDRYIRAYGADFVYGVNALFRYCPRYEENHTIHRSTGAYKNDYDLSGKLYKIDDAGEYNPFDVDLRKERKGGLIRKDFGNKYDYHSGIASTWAQGVDMKGIHKTFNYGGRYVENNATLEAEPQGYTKEKLDEAKPGSQLPAVWGNEALVTQNFGDTYEHIEGKHVVGHKGEYTFQRDGATTETITGDITRTITGNITEDINGDISKTLIASKEDITKTLSGDSTKTTTSSGSHTENTSTAGEKTLIDMAKARVNTFIGQVSEINTDPESSTSVGFVTETFAGGKVSNFIGATMDLKLAATVNIEKTMKIYDSNTDTEKSVTRIVNVNNNIVKNNINIVKAKITIIG